MCVSVRNNVKKLKKMVLLVLNGMFNKEALKNFFAASMSERKKRKKKNEAQLHIFGFQQFCCLFCPSFSFLIGNYSYSSAFCIPLASRKNSLRGVPRECTYRRELRYRELLL